MLFLVSLQIVLCDFIAWRITFLQIIAVFAAPSITRWSSSNTTDVSLHRRRTLAKNINLLRCWDISKETQIKREWNTNPQATCEDNSSWCWALVRLAASPPELAAPESHCSSRPASGDKVQGIGLLQQQIGCKKCARGEMRARCSPVPSALWPCRSPRGWTQACCCSRAELWGGGRTSILAAPSGDFGCGGRSNIDLHLNQYTGEFNSVCLGSGNRSSAKEEMPPYCASFFAQLVVWKGEPELPKNI